ncbi:MAG: hypothetical protein ACXABG_13800, partial [Promethearchaeota archaeon]
MLDDIREEFGKPKPNSKKILKVLYQLGKDAKHQKITDSEFFDAVGETFIMQPEFFMNELYPVFMERIAKIIGVDKRKEMERYILEKFCLLGDEEIIYELEGNITQKDTGLGRRPVELSISSGDIFLTNYRLIAHGMLEVFGDRSIWAVSWRNFVPTWRSMLNPWVKQKRLKPGSKAIERGKDLVDSNPIFGYQFPNDIYKASLHAGSGCITYLVEHDELRCLILIKPTDRSKRDENLNNIFDMLSGGPNEVLDVILEIYKNVKKERFKRRNILLFLKYVKKQLGREES